MTTEKKGSSSGHHPAVQELRKKLDSIGENQLPELERINRRVDRLRAKRRSDRPLPKNDPRREEEGEIQSIEVVDLTDEVEEATDSTRDTVP